VQPKIYTTFEEKVLHTSELETEEVIKHNTKFFTVCLQELGSAQMWSIKAKA